MPGPRFLTLDEVADELATSRAQVYALIRRGDLAAIKLGGRGQWRVERAKLEDYINALYNQTRRWIDQHPWCADDESDHGPQDLPPPDTEDSPQDP